VPPRLELTPDTAALQIGQQTHLSAAYYDEFGAEDADLAVIWSSADPTIASIDATGLLAAQREGQVAIVATIAGVLSDSILVTVVLDPEAQIAVVRVSPTTAGLSIGDTLQFSATSHSAGGGELPAEGFTWRSTDANILHIDDDGRAIALASGRVTIRATTAGIQSTVVEITIMGMERLGSFFGVAGHDAQGTVRLTRDGGSLLLIFGEDFNVDSGPQLEVFLAPSEQFGPGSVNVGELQSTRGLQTYIVPASVELGDLDWVIVHCVPYNISFGRAMLQ
jgi:hypothetical protein